MHKSTSFFNILQDKAPSEKHKKQKEEQKNKKKERRETLTNNLTEIWVRYDKLRYDKLSYE